MKYSITALLLTAAITAVASPSVSAMTPKRASAPVTFNMPAFPDGSSRSRAPFPSERWQNDVLPPNGQPFDLALPPNTPATTSEPFELPPPTFAIFQSKPAPGLMPTGRPTVAASDALDVQAVEPALQNTPFDGRDQLIDGLRVRVRQSETTFSEFRRTENEMSAEGRAQFNAGAAEVRTRETALEKSLRAAARASAANWDATRAQLANDYQAYADAVARVDAAAGLAPGH